MRRFLALAAAAVVVLSCSDDRGQPTSSLSDSPPADISDGAHGGEYSQFYFLPELVESPTIAGVFNPDIPARIRICELGNDAGGPAVEEPAEPDNPVCVSGTDRELVGPIFGDEIAEQYSYVWRTDDAPGLDPNHYYRLRVTVGLGEDEIELGYRDLDPEYSPPSGSGAKQASYYPFNYGNTINIKFWIGEGLFCLGDPANCGECLYSTSGADDGNNDYVGRACNANEFAGVYVPPNTPEVEGVLIIPEYIPVGGSVTLPDGSVLTCEDAGDGQVDFFKGGFALPQYPGCFTIRTIPDITGVNLTNAAIVGLCPDIADDNLHAVIHRTDDANNPSFVQALNPASTEIDINGTTVDFLSCPTAGTSSLAMQLLNKLNPFHAEPAYATHKTLKGGDTPSFSDFVWALPSQEEKELSGDNQTGLVNTILPTPLTVNVSDKNPGHTPEEEPVAGADVTFTLRETGSGGGLAWLPSGATDCTGVTGTDAELTGTTGTGGQLDVCLTLPNASGVYHVDVGGYGIGVRGESWTINGLTGIGPYSHFVSTLDPTPITLPDPYVPVIFTATACVPGEGSATIDGELSPGEWDCAGAPEPFEANLGGGKSTGFFYQMTSSDGYLYLGVWVPVDKNASLKENTLTFYLNDSGEPELTSGDDVLVIDGVTNTFIDQYWTEGNCPRGQSYCAFDDPDDPQGEGAMKLNLVDGNPEFYFYEIKHPLCSGSPYDVCVSSTLNGAFTFRWAGKGTKGNTEVPGPFGVYEQYLP